MRNNITSRDALIAAIDYAKLQNNDPHCVDIRFDGEMYELTIYTAFQRYDFYVDAANGEVCGVNTEPVLDTENAYDRVVAKANNEAIVA